MVQETSSGACIDRCAALTTRSRTSHLGRGLTFRYHIQTHEQPKIVVYERVGGVRDCWLYRMMSLVYPTKADTKRSGWRRLGRELWDLIHQLPGTERASTDRIIG
jgi:hypothetical protein